MATELSSNWKKLQATLSQDRNSQDRNRDLKRKASPTDRQQNSLAKRKRIEVKAAALPSSGLIRKRSGMGNGNSAAAGTEQSNLPSASLVLWAEENDISSKDLAEAYGVGLKDAALQGATKDKTNEGLSKEAEIGQYIGMDCEMVGVGGEEDRSVLARVSIVNFHGVQVYDSLVRPKEFVTDWRTHITGISPKDMATARSFEEVQKDVADLLKDRVLIGHAIKHDLDAVMLGHPRKDIRDTSRFSGFRKFSAGRTPSLKKLAKEVLGVDIQKGEHSSIEDARATMLLFRRHKPAIDLEHAKRFPQRSVHASEDKAKSKRKAKNRRGC